VTDRWTQIRSICHASIALHEVHYLLHSRQLTTSFDVTAVVQNVRWITSSKIITGLDLQKQNFKYNTENLTICQINGANLHAVFSCATSVFTSMTLFYQDICKKVMGKRS